MKRPIGRAGCPGWCRWLLLLVAAVSLRAHDPGLSTAQGELKGGVLVLVTGFAPSDAGHLLPPSVPREEQWGPAEFAAAQTELQALSPQLWEIAADGRRIAPRETGVELLPDDNMSFRGVYPLPADAKRLVLRGARVAQLPAGHRQFVIVMDERGSTLVKKLLSAADAEIDLPLGAGADGGGVPAGAGAGELPTAIGFVRLGVEHIWTGYDHLLFLFALLVVCRTFRSIAGIITCFTLAHSLTLALATLNLVTLPARLVEPLIAASIVYVAVENLLRRGAEPRGRWALTFGFGLIHGFGFAGVLRDLGVGGAGDGIALPLFTFNLGVELGQIVIAGAVLPLVWRLRRNPNFVARGVPALSAAVALAGLYWLLARTIFS